MLKIGNILNPFFPLSAGCAAQYTLPMSWRERELPAPLETGIPHGASSPGWDMQQHSWADSSNQDGDVQNCHWRQAHLRLHLGTDVSTLCAVRRVENPSRLMVAMGTTNDVRVQGFDHLLQLLRF